MEFQIEKTRLTLVQGDITRQHAVDAIVNAANSGLRGGGGVDGAIHRAGGPAIMEACREIRGGCPTGQAVSTTAGRLSAKRVIHTVGPIWRGGKRSEEALLESAYQNSLAVARNEGLRVVAFPSISTGVYSFPIDRAAEIALGTIIRCVREHPAAFDEVRMVLFSQEDLQAYVASLGQLTRHA